MYCVYTALFLRLLPCLALIPDFFNSLLFTCELIYINEKIISMLYITKSIHISIIRWLFDFISKKKEGRDYYDLRSAGMNP